jgi:hypothetical protein
MVDLQKLEKNLDDALAKETTESLTAWLQNERKKLKIFDDVTGNSYLCKKIPQMSTKDKLVERFKYQPKDFTFDELERLLASLGFVRSNKGKTSGSRVRFMNIAVNCFVDTHKPHTNGAPIKETALKDIYSKLIANNLI